MVHLRIVSPADRTEKVMALLEATPSVFNLILLPGSARQASGEKRSRMTEAAPRA